MRTKEQIAKRATYAWYLHSRNKWNAAKNTWNILLASVVVWLFVGLSGLYLGTEVLHWLLLLPVLAFITLAVYRTLKFRHVLKRSLWVQDYYRGVPQ